MSFELIFLPEEVLEKLKCSFCKQYLSCGPTKITSTGVACGRCSVQKDGVSSLFNTVAQSALFPCVNRYDGCYNKLLRYDNVKNHEEQCIGKMYRCPLCSSAPDYTLLSLINHYNQEHSRYILKNPVIHLPTEFIIDAAHYLYCDEINICLFFIYVNWDGESVECNVSLAGRKGKAKQVIQMVNKTNYKDYCTAFMDYNYNLKVFQISSKELQQQGNTVLVEFLLLHNPGQALHYEPLVLNEGIDNWPKMFIGEEFVKNFGAVELNEFEYKPKSLELVNTNGDIISIKCSFCENYFWDCKWNIKFSIIYCCTAGGDINYCDVCKSCYSKGYKMCTLHQRELTPMKSRKIYDIFFYCRNNCRLFFKFWQLQKHELLCFGISQENVKRSFGLLFLPSINYIKGNVVYYRNWVNTTEVYMVTHDGVKCILNIVIEKPYLTFQGSHDYDKSKYYLLFRICENGQVREEIHTFSIVQSSAKDVFFAVFLKEIKHKTMLVIKD